ncbi:SDR family NAD(P)-dependent oxidoreductase [Companilactobacillus halodurans]|uniref:SDR family oxidoreductase n=1 Tax=Companilactobacillus halodurans TaxID=2584183 RepID=A0A5P0ZUR6_9LACO|nr:SDR family oxidoreductase [Companilactobacillus halodurans]MQS96779.1 SDR family oxidoreductase [Companilactobacillus halodurans]
MSIKDKVVIITDASSGIGAATTRELAKKHAKLVIGARRLEKPNELKNEFPDEQIIAQKVDVTNLNEVQDLINTANKQFGHIDALYNNAGVMPVNALINCARAEWRQILNVNIMGIINGIAAVLPTMVKQKYGHILATDSLAGHVVVPNLAVYKGSKFAVRAIMEGLREEQHKNNIRTTIVSPGAVSTELYKSINNPDNQKAEINVEKQIGLSAENIANSIAFAIDAPNNMDVNELIIRPIKQDV